MTGILIGILVIVLLVAVFVLCGALAKAAGVADRWSNEIHRAITKGVMDKSHAGD